MTKKEIYEQVVRLTSELKETGIAEKVFMAAQEGNDERVDAIIVAFPEYYPDLYQRIISFGIKFNMLVGDSKKNKERLNEILQDCKVMMYSLVGTEIIGQVADALEARDAKKLLEIIRDFKEQYSTFSENLVDFQKKYDEYRKSLGSGHEGEIFANEADEENGIFVFDTNVIDAPSFYLLSIIANISDCYFFYDEEIQEDGQELSITASEKFFDAIARATCEEFGDFVSNYNFPDWVGEDADYQSVGELLVDAMHGQFE